MTPPLARVLERTAVPGATGEPASARHPVRAADRGLAPRGERALAAVAVIRREWLPCALSRRPGLPDEKSVDPEPQYRRLAVQVQH